MTEFYSYKSYINFRAHVLGRQRYFRDADVEQFLETVLATSHRRVKTIRQGAVVFRAQLGHDWETLRAEDYGEDITIPCAYSPSRMVPFSNQASEGRANPKGIPVLYVANTAETAMAEVRPWVGAHVSVAQFITLRPLSVVRCSVDDGYERPLRVFWDGKEPDATVREQEVWDDINDAFSTPVTPSHITPSDMTAEYAPTQVLAEFFKSSGFDGVAYRSSLGDGHNIALFDLNCARLINCTLYQTDKSNFTFSECSNTYFVKEQTKHDEQNT